MKRRFDSFKFESVLLEAIDETLLAYGKNTKKAFYEYFKEVLNLPRPKIPEKIEEFSRGLEDLIGVGSRNLEILVMLKLHEKIGVAWDCNIRNQPDSPDLTFKEYLSFAKKYFEEANNYEDKISIFVTEKEARSIYR